MEVIRTRPIKQFRVLRAYGGYVKGQLIQPTGMYRQVLLTRGLIEEVKDAEAVEVALQQNRQLPPAADRMVRTSGKGEARPGLFSRGKRGG